MILENAMSIFIAIVAVVLAYHIGKLLQSITEWTIKFIGHLVNFVIGFGKLVTGIVILTTVAVLIWGGGESLERLLGLYKTLQLTGIT